MSLSVSRQESLTLLNLCVANTMAQESHLSQTMPVCSMRPGISSIVGRKISSVHTWSLVQIDVSMLQTLVTGWGINCRTLRICSVGIMEYWRFIGAFCVDDVISWSILLMLWQNGLTVVIKTRSPHFYIFVFTPLLFLLTHPFLSLDVMIYSRRLC